MSRNTNGRKSLNDDKDDKRDGKRTAKDDIEFESDHDTEKDTNSGRKNESKRDNVKENPTINDDNHNKHQDNELANLQKQNDNIRKEMKEDHDRQKDIPTKPRLVQADEDEKKVFDEASRNDKIALKTETSSHLNVVINQTIGSLQGNATQIGMKSIPLSTYKFGSVNRTVTDNYGITPFRITRDFPQMFKFVVNYNAAQQVNIPNLVLTNYAKTDVLDTIRTSIDLFNIATMTARVELNDKIAEMKIIDPNDTSHGTIKLMHLNPSAHVDPQASVNFIESRIMSLLTAFSALNDLLVTMPMKITCFDEVRGGNTASALARMPFYPDQGPHPYYSVFSNIPDWARNYYDDAFATCPLEIGDLAVDSYSGAKLSQYNKVIIDQFTAAILRLNFYKIRNHTLTTDRMQDLILASMFKKDKLEVESLIDVEDFSLLYSYTSNEFNLAMFHILTSQRTKTEIIDFLVEEITKTNRLGMCELADVWKGLQLGDIYSQKFNSDWMQSIYVGDLTTPYHLLIYETFSDFFVFSPKFSSLPDSLNAVTEILSIYTFMILYPRITQRMIHKLGYRLTQLYNTMFPQIFNEFKMKYGDVRTDFGAKKFDAYGKQLTMQDSQNGYVYSIFTTLPIISPKSRHQNLLQDFISLINSLRTLALPPIVTIELDAKRRAGYPYLYDNYSTYASWSPIDYYDYSINQETDLGIRLRSLVGESNRFRELFLKQNPASSRIPRAFEAYYTAWTTQLSRIIVTAGAPYQLTCAMMQETLFNSPFYVGSTYNPNPEMFWYVQKDIGIGPLASGNLAAVIVPSKIRVDNFKINAGMCMALTIEGEYLRNIFIPDEIDCGYEQNQTRIRDNITVMDAVACYKMMNKVVAHSRNFGYAMQVTQWLTMPQSPENPFKDLVVQLAKYMKMAAWVPLARKIFEFFSVDFDDYFIKIVANSSFITDGRYLDRTLVIVDPSTATPAKDQPLNSKFNVKFEYIVADDIAKINILSRPLLSLNSKIIYIQNDWYFGRMIVTELGPTQRKLAKTNWTDETTYSMGARFSRIVLKKGQAAQLEYVSDITNEKQVMILPHGSSNTQTLLLNIDYVTDLPLQYLRVIAKAVSLGKMILRIKHMRLRVFIEDMPSRTVDYSIPYMSEDEVFDIIAAPSGTIRDWTFKSTNYAINFSGNAFVIPSYIQWFATEHEADKNIFMGVVTDAIDQQSQTRMPLPEEMGYGPDAEGTRFNNNALKVESNIINWNNCVPTVSDKLLDHIKVNIIPWYPQEM